MDAFLVPLVAGDHGRPLLLTVRDRFVAAPGRTLNPRDPGTWAPYDLSRIVAIRVPVRPADFSRPPFPLTAMPLQPYGNGDCLVIWPPELFATPGRYEGELSLEYPDGAVETVYRRLLFTVRTRF
ncbi:MAG: hypothetical protein HQL99_14150 [Magnetococcales bacterium]|nr:hypothetical protein [Magnetococcales bacterium]